MRITKQDVRTMFQRFITTVDSNQWPNNNDVFDLDYNAAYGGYLIEKINPDTSVSHPFLNKRLRAKEMYDALNMACTALDFYRRNV